MDLGSEVTVMKDKVGSFDQFMKTANVKLDELSSKVDEIDIVSCIKFCCFFPSCFFFFLTINSFSCQ